MKLSITLAAAFAASLSRSVLASALYDVQPQIFHPETIEQLTEARIWSAQQDRQSLDNYDVVPFEHWSVTCTSDVCPASHTCVNETDVENALTFMRFWCNKGGIVPARGAVWWDFGLARIAIVSSGGIQPCSSGEINQVYAQLATRCPSYTSGMNRTGEWFEADWKKTYVLSDCEDGTVGPWKGQRCRNKCRDVSGKCPDNDPSDDDPDDDDDGDHASVVSNASNRDSEFSGENDYLDIALPRSTDKRSTVECSIPRTTS